MKDKKHFLNINWKIRWLNPQFIFAIAKSLVVSLITYTGLTETDLSSWRALGAVLVGVLSNPVMLLNIADAVYNAIIDFTVKGGRDSQLTLNKDRATDPDMPVEIEGPDVVDDESTITVENDESEKHKPKIEEV